MSKLPIIINNKEYEVRANASILQACEDLGIIIPRFCYHEKLSVAGNCRICLVEVEKSPKPVVSCAMPISKNMIIYTETPLVKKAREAVLEFLLINHPLDCPICDQGGECDLQDETLAYASDRSRYLEYKRSVEDKECGPIIKTIMTRCIHCTRCIRFSTEISGQEILGSFGRGEDTEIGTYIQTFIKTELSGNLVDICPVGALTSKPYAYKARSWELQKNDTIDFFDGVCSDIIVQTRKSSQSSLKLNNKFSITKEEILRVLPRNNGLYIDNWISDKTRYAFDGLKNQRITTPIYYNKNKGIEKQDWATVLLDLADRLSINLFQYWGNNMIQMFPPVRLAIIADSLIDLEGLYILSQMLKVYGGTDIQYSSNKMYLNIDIPNFYLLNKQINNLENLSSVLLIGVNTRNEASLFNTGLRKQQLKRNLLYTYIGNSVSLNLQNNHLGNNVQTLISLLNNKNNIVKEIININKTSIFFGVEYLKSINGNILQNIFRSLAKIFLTQNRNEERLGGIHTNITSLSFANLGISAGVRSNLNNKLIKDKKINTLFIIQPFNFYAKKFISKFNYTHTITLATHKPINYISDYVLPLKNFYEKEGFVYNIEGRLRKFYKVITAPKNVRSLETFFTLLLRAQFLKQDWIDTLKWLWSFEDEIKIETSIEKFNAPYNLSYINTNILKNNQNNIKLIRVPFFKTTTNFYITDLITKNSIVMAETSLFNLSTTTTEHKKC